MCPYCFEIEFPSFPTNQEWMDFDILLSLKLNSHKLKFVSDESNGAGEYTYECLSCKQKWKLHDPDRNDRGSFLAV
jgi:hypothetical protein